ncbi:MAG TPA: M4 family metallopeptidase, partial [Streptomyces sp.]|nr:M4 family metallopeptidase [Streptomyces sp.]
ALTERMTSTTNYAGARTATLQAAAGLYGQNSAEYNAVAHAWAAVNVGARPSGG